MHDVVVVYVLDGSQQHESEVSCLHLCVCLALLDAVEEGPALDALHDDVEVLLLLVEFEHLYDIGVAGSINQ